MPLALLRGDADAGLRLNDLTRLRDDKIPRWRIAAIAGNRQCNIDRLVAVDRSHNKAIER